MKVAAHCLWVKKDRNYTFVITQVSNLQNFKPVIFTYAENNADAYSGIPIYAPYSSKSSYLFKNLNRVTKRLWNCPLEFARAVKKHKVSLFHAHFGPYGIEFLPIAKKYKLPLVVSFYGYDISSFCHDRQYRIELRKLFNEGDLFLVEGEHAMKIVEELGCPEEKVAIHHIGIELEKYTFEYRKIEKKSEETRFLMCSALEEKKGVLYGLEAFGRISMKYPNLRMNIIGNGSLRSEIEDRIERLGIKEKVNLLGALPHSQCIREMSRCHIFLAPSVTAEDGETEGGAPTVLIEAQAAGMPVLSTYHADIPEIVLDGKTGFLVPEKDVDGLAEKMAYLAEHTEIWGKMGEEGRNHVAINHDILIQTQKLERLYNGLIREA